MDGGQDLTQAARHIVVSMQETTLSRPLSLQEVGFNGRNEGKHHSEGKEGVGARDVSQWVTVCPRSQLP